MIEVLIPFLFMKMHNGEESQKEKEEERKNNFKTPGKFPFKDDFLSPIEKQQQFTSSKKRDISPLG